MDDFDRKKFWLWRKNTENSFAYSCISENSKHFFPYKNIHFLSGQGFCPPPLADMYAKNVSFGRLPLMCIYSSEPIVCSSGKHNVIKLYIYENNMTLPLCFCSSWPKPIDHSAPSQSPRPIDRQYRLKRKEGSKVRPHSLHVSNNA